MPDILQRILAVKAKEVAAAKTQRPLSAMRIAAAISPAAPAPCTATGYRTTGMHGKRRASVVSTSRNAAARREVTMPMRRG